MHHERDLPPRYDTLSFVYFGGPITEVVVGGAAIWFGVMWSGVLGDHSQVSWPIGDVVSLNLPLANFAVTGQLAEAVRSGIIMASGNVYSWTLIYGGGAAKMTLDLEPHDVPADDAE